MLTCSMVVIISLNTREPPVVHFIYNNEQVNKCSRDSGTSHTGNYMLDCERFMKCCSGPRPFRGCWQSLPCEVKHCMRELITFYPLGFPVWLQKPSIYWGLCMELCIMTGLHQVTDLKQFLESMALGFSGEGLTSSPHATPIGATQASQTGSRTHISHLWGDINLSPTEYS